MFHILLAMELELSPLILCRQVVERPGGAGISGIEGMFNIERYASFPAIMRPDALLYGHLLGVRRPTELTITLMYAADGDVVFSECFRGRTTVSPPRDFRDVTHLVLEIGEPQLPGAGEYRWEVRVGDRLLGRALMRADKLGMERV